MYTSNVFNVILCASSCFCFAGYELFQGFNVNDVDDTSATTTDLFLKSIFDEKSRTSQVTSQSQQFLKEQNSTTARHTILKEASKSNLIQVKSLINKNEGLTEATILKLTKFACPEDEKPFNIGPYEIPTRRDVVLFTRNMLLDMFNSYNKQAFILLTDIKSASQAALSIEKGCKGFRMAYRECVKLVSKQSQQITKNIVKALEEKKQQIFNFTNENICNLTATLKDPMEMLKSLAQEKVSLEFALPGFLRLLGTCSVHCVRSTFALSNNNNKPTRHMTDQDLVVKHFLTRKNYLELIMDSKHKSTANSN